MKYVLYHTLYPSFVFHSLLASPSQYFHFKVFGKIYQSLLSLYIGRRIPGRLDFLNIYDIKLLDSKDVLDLAEKLDLIQIYIDVH